MSKRHGFRFLALCVAGALMSTGSAIAGAEPLAAIRVKGGSVYFVPQVAAAEFVLTVAGPDGQVVRESFAAGETPVFQPSADGAYTYELVAVPFVSDEARAAMRRARRSGDMNEVEELRNRGLLERPRPAQSGPFLVKNGAPVAPRGARSR
jgi:hypothetical protein